MISVYNCHVYQEDSVYISLAEKGLLPRRATSMAEPTFLFNKIYYRQHVVIIVFGHIQVSNIYRFSRTRFVNFLAPFKLSKLVISYK